MPRFHEWARCRSNVSIWAAVCVCGSFDNILGPHKCHIKHMLK